MPPLCLLPVLSRFPERAFLAATGIFGGEGRRCETKQVSQAEMNSSVAEPGK